MELERGDFGSTAIANENGDEATQEINLNTSSTQEEEAAIEKRKEQVRIEIKEVEGDIQTLKQAIVRKEALLVELRKELGVTRWSQFRDGLNERYHNYQSSEMYNRLSAASTSTKQTLGAAGEKTSAAFKSFGSATAKKWQDIRESPKFQTMEEKLWATTGAVKAKLTRQGTETAVTETNGNSDKKPAEPSAI